MPRLYDHPLDDGPSEVCRAVGRFVDIGAITEYQYHVMLGRYFGYPLCCIEAFVEEDYEGMLITDDKLGTFYHCLDCAERKGYDNIRED